MAFFATYHAVRVCIANPNNARFAWWDDTSHVLPSTDRDIAPGPCDRKCIAIPVQGGKPRPCPPGSALRTDKPGGPPRQHDVESHVQDRSLYLGKRLGFHDSVVVPDGLRLGDACFGDHSPILRQTLHAAGDAAASACRVTAVMPLPKAAVFRGSFSIDKRIRNNYTDTVLLGSTPVGPRIAGREAGITAREL